MNDIKELIRAHVRELITDAVRSVVREELGGAAEPGDTPAPKSTTPVPSAVSPTLPKRVRQQRYSSTCYVRVNPTFKGSVGAAGGRTAEVYDAIRQHIGAKPIIRVALVKEVALLLGVGHHVVTPQVTKLLDGGALVVHVPTVGDATA